VSLGMYSAEVKAHVQIIPNPHSSSPRAGTTTHAPNVVYPYSGLLLRNEYENKLLIDPATFRVLKTTLSGRRQMCTIPLIWKCPENANLWK
jgi:hypothetical protein